MTGNAAVQGTVVTITVELDDNKLKDLENGTLSLIGLSNTHGSVWIPVNKCYSIEWDEGDTVKAVYGPLE